MKHPSDERLSAFLDGDTGPEESSEIRAHLEACSVCSACLRELESLRSLLEVPPQRQPRRDLFASVMSSRGESSSPSVQIRRPVRRWIPMAVAAAAAVMAMGWWLKDDGSTSLPDVRTRYLLLLHEPEAAFDPGVDVAALVDEYSSWIAGLAQEGAAEGGEKLADRGGYTLDGEGERRDLDPGPRVTGFFVIRAKSEAEARSIGETCPHLKYGGWVEVRRIEET